MKALVIGGATIDVITSIEPDDIECISMKNATNSFLMMEQGKKVEASRIDTHVGGGATNAAVCMARLGGEVSAVLKIGDDLDGQSILSRLNSEGINTDFVVKEPDQSTGKSVVVCSHDRNAGIFVNRGANTSLKDQEITQSMFDGIDMVYVSTLSAASAAVFPKIVELAKKSGAFVACNPGIRQIRRRKEKLIEALKWVDLLAINKEESEALAEGFLTPSPHFPDCNTGDPVLYREGLGEKSSKVSLPDFTEKIMGMGCKYVVITNGSEGAYLASDNAILFRPAIPCVVEATIGAGDAFNATIAYALADKKTVWTALSMAAVNASAVAATLDTQSGLMCNDALKSRVLPMDNSRIPTFQIKETDAA
ncbi:carbohydrate kinase family protein [Terasakiella sp. A23]|uniref:carbohydrate kinase family protein n=1 Tax=Terasakiella sp. FCG-A23 TaxID=3080561 RepID=UPI0029540431|nr:carbohydrate kinase family protein [Terasakiella sp. A23]MDV7340587.1 carbohydrate kinase family protein [Terasakiella sp. A23]